MKTAHVFTFVVLGSVALAGGACSGRTSVVPNSDKSLRRSSAEFAADAAQRHPYKSDAPRGGEAQARAQVGYMLDRIELVNLSPEPWENVEVWVNREYVVFIPRMESGRLKRLDFQMIFNGQGKYLPLDKYQIKTVELYRNGTMYSVPVQLAD